MTSTNKSRPQTAASQFSPVEQADRRAYTMREVADAWGISERTVWSLINSGQLEAFKAGRSVRVSQSVMTAFEQGRGRTSS